MAGGQRAKTTTVERAGRAPQRIVAGWDVSRRAFSPIVGGWRQCGYLSGSSGPLPCRRVSGVGDTSKSG